METGNERDREKTKIWELKGEGVDETIEVIIRKLREIKEEVGKERGKGRRKKGW